FFFQAEDGIRDFHVTGVQTCALPIYEIAELPAELQPKLLKFLETRSFRRLGGNREHTADVRLIAATSRNLADEVEAGRFREDLRSEERRVGKECRARGGGAKLSKKRG